MPIPIPTREYSMNTIRTLAIAAFVLGGVTLARAERCAIAVSDPKVDFGRVFGDRIGAPRGADRRPVASANRALAVQCRQESVAAIRFDGVPSADGSIRLGDVARYTVTVTRVALDGRDVMAGVARGGDAAAVTLAPLILMPGDMLVPYDANRPAAGRRLDVFIRIDAFRAAETTLSGEVTVTSEPRFSVVSTP
ncbi:hypothetical protein L0Z42_22520 [Burkholderia multivorans]|uniref:hypothetical protein n=1 Tax=Burkholderia multivorans TaxID=87883 RepID=UPI0020187A3B|nr:hypothetical protein [Burkholderia multivorans]MCO1373280.1 hypothetical protein [Burkholderia multivorans]MCO1455462.1 hypothetical protein [Burkholderia multivorans]MCO1470014.1 hypothetical protein [Burkholderia multivorans]UQO20341.1 hypothetical protein L0Z02_19880 [Burkholderia multivorans]UQO83434.1 hypothetical protein L0Y86_03655 [Burkholderia multivorans]